MRRKENSDNSYNFDTSTLKHYGVMSGKLNNNQTLFFQSNLKDEPFEKHYTYYDSEESFLKKKNVELCIVTTVPKLSALVKSNDLTICNKISLQIKHFLRGPMTYNLLDIPITTKFCPKYDISKILEDEKIIEHIGKLSLPNESLFLPTKKYTEKTNEFFRHISSFPTTKFIFVNRTYPNENKIAKDYFLFFARRGTLSKSSSKELSSDTMINMMLKTRLVSRVSNKH